MFEPKEGIMPGNVGDRDEVSPNGWDCFQCTASIDLGRHIGDMVECPRCGTKYEVKSEIQKVTRMTVEMTGRGLDEPRLGLVLHGYGSYRGKLLF